MRVRDDMKNVARDITSQIECGARVNVDKEYALLDEFDKVSALLEDMIEEEIQVTELEEWPLFIQYRKSDEYGEFKKVHRELFDVLGYKL